MLRAAYQARTFPAAAPAAVTQHSELGTQHSKKEAPKAVTGLRGWCSVQERFFASSPGIGAGVAVAAK